MGDFINIKPPKSTVASDYPGVFDIPDNRLTDFTSKAEAHAFLYSKSAANFFLDRIKAARQKAGITWSFKVYAEVHSAIRSANVFAAQPSTMQADGVDGRGKNLTPVIESGLRHWTDDLTVAAFRNSLAPVISNPAPDLRRMFASPVTAATLYAINVLPTMGGHPKRMLALHYMTLAKGESDFNPGAQAKKTTAKGQLQIINATYRAARDVFYRTLTQVGSYLPVLMSSFFSRQRKGKYFDANRSNPAYDATQYQANVGVLLQHLNAISANWILDATGWRPRASRPGSALLISRYRAELMDPDVGRQLLMTYYHINGAGADSLSSLSHTNRLTNDTEYFADLLASPSLPDFLFLTAQQEVEKGTGLSLASIKGSDVEVNNAILAQTTGLKGRVTPTGNPVITSDFGSRNPTQYGTSLAALISSKHKGLDLRAAKGTPVFAVDDGVIQSLYFKIGKGWGRALVLQSSTDGALFRYAHLSKILATKGTAVKKGQLIALSGMTGTNQPHLHLEYIPKGITQVDPQKDPMQRWKNAL